MSLGLLLLIVGIILAIVSAFVPAVGGRLLAAAVVLIGLAVLVGVTPVTL